MKVSLTGPRVTLCGPASPPFMPQCLRNGDEDGGFANNCAAHDGMFVGDCIGDVAKAHPSLAIEGGSFATTLPRTPLSHNFFGAAIAAAGAAGVAFVSKIFAALLSPGCAVW